MRLPSHLTVAAVVRRASGGAYVIRKGDPDSGEIYVQTRNAVFRAKGDSFEKVCEKGETEAYLARAAARDPDIWIVEVEGDLSFPVF